MRRSRGKKSVFCQKILTPYVDHLSQAVVRVVQRAAGGRSGTALTALGLFAMNRR